MIQRAMEKKRSGEGGFTLVELLIVIVILGILAAIVVLAIGGLSGSAQTASCKSGAHTIESAEDALFASSNAPAYGDVADARDGRSAQAAGGQIPFDRDCHGRWLHDHRHEHRRWPELHRHEHHVPVVHG